MQISDDLNTESSTVDKLQRGRRWKPTMPNYFSFKILKAFNISLIFKPSTGLLCCGINGPPDWVEVTLNCHPNIIQMLSTYMFSFHIFCAVQEPDWLSWAPRPHLPPLFCPYSRCLGEGTSTSKTFIGRTTITIFRRNRITPVAGVPSSKGDFAAWCLVFLFSKPARAQRAGPVRC